MLIAGFFALGKIQQKKALDKYAERLYSIKPPAGVSIAGKDKAVRYGGNAMYPFLTAAVLLETADDNYNISEVLDYYSKIKYRMRECTKDTSVVPIHVYRGPAEKFDFYETEQLTEANDRNQRVFDKALHKKKDIFYIVIYAVCSDNHYYLFGI